MVVLQLASNQLSPRIPRTTAAEPLAPAALALVAIGWSAFVVLAFLYFLGYTVSRIIGRLLDDLEKVTDGDHGRAVRRLREQIVIVPPMV